MDRKGAAGVPGGRLPTGLPQLDVPRQPSPREPATLFNKWEVLFLLQRPPGLGSPPDRVSWPQEDSMTGSLVGDRNIKVG